MKDLNLIRKIAWSFHKTTKIDFDELFSEAALSYCEAIPLYSPDKGKLSVWVWVKMRNHLLNFIAEERKQPTNLKDTNNPSPDSRVCFQPETFEEFFLNLPPEVKQIAWITLNSIDSIPDTLPPKFARGEIAEILRCYGWTWPEIRTGIRNMKLALI